MLTRLPPLPYGSGRDSFAQLLMSDIHIGASNLDKALLSADLEWAKQHNARVFMAGDVFDLLLPKDHKRFNPSVLDPALSGSDAVINDALDLAVRLLGPYAEHIYVIGCGNHETAATRHHSLDIVAMLVERLQQEARKRNPEHVICHGGYSGAIVQQFRRESGGGRTWAVWYHHGIGGAAPVTKGLIDFNRFSTYVENADVIWIGHKHNRVVVDTYNHVIPSRGPDIVEHRQWHVQTGAYTGGVFQQLSKNKKYLSDFGVEKGFAPQGRGGVRFFLSPDWNAAKVRSEVVL